MPSGLVSAMVNNSTTLSVNQLGRLSNDNRNVATLIDQTLGYRYCESDFAIPEAELHSRLERKHND
jgi:hypothetical protein